MTAVLMEDELYGCEETTTVAGGSLESTLYEGLFVGLSSLGHHEAYLQHKVNELEGMLRERNVEIHKLMGQLEDRDQQIGCFLTPDVTRLLRAGFIQVSQLLNVTAERDVLLRNISCLYNTAKEEMARKQAEINSLRADIAAARQQQHHVQRPMQRDLQLCCPTLPAGVEALRATRQALPAGSKRSRDAEMDHGNNDLRSNAEEAGAKRTRCHDVHDGAVADDGFKGEIGAWQQKGTSPPAQPGKKFGTMSASVEARWHSSCLGTRNTGRSMSCEGGTSDDRVQYPGLHQVSKHRAKENSNGRHESHGVGLAKNIGELNASAKGSECGTSQRAGNCSRAGYLESSRDNTRERLRERDSRARELHEGTRFGYEDNQKDRDQQRSSRRVNPSDVDARGPRTAERSAGADTGRHRDPGCLKERGSSIGDRARVLHGSERSGSRIRQEREWPLARD